MGRLDGKPFGWREETRVHDFVVGQDHETGREQVGKSVGNLAGRSIGNTEGRPVLSVIGKTAENTGKKSVRNVVEICGREIQFL